MKTCLIISGGDFCNLPAACHYDFVIACDHGYDHAIKLRIKPDLLLGDFDSIGITPEDTDSNVRIYPAQKDDSDTMLAVKYALKHGYEKILITCALGGRLDHAIANIQTMAYVASNGVECELFGAGEHLRTFTGKEIELGVKAGRSLSLFALTDRCEHVSISGAAYNVKDTTLTNTFPLGLSNKWADESVKITMENGILLIVESDMFSE